MTDKKISDLGALLRQVQTDPYRLILIDALPTIVWLANPQGECVFINQQWQRFTGQAPEEAQGRGWMTPIHPDDKIAWYHAFQQAITQKQSFRTECRVKRKDGVYRWIAMTFAPLLNEDGLIQGFAGSFMDVTELKEVDRVKDEFVTTVSHELRTPLTIVREGVSQIHDGLVGPVSEPQKKLLEMALSNMDRLERIIHDLLDISKIEEASGDVKREMIDLVTIAKEVIASMMIKAQKKGLQLSGAFAAERMEVYANRDRIAQVFINLIGNAIKFTEQGKIEVQVEDRENEAVCRVIDTGKGIAKEDLPRVFSKFQQFGRTPGPGDMGTGLGLAICKGILDLHQGNIEVVSEPEQGSTFTFTLPKFNPIAMFKEYMRDSAQIADKQHGAVSVISFHIQNAPAFFERLGEEKAQNIISQMKDALKPQLKRKTYAVIKKPNTIIAAFPLTARREALQLTENSRRIFSRILREHKVEILLDMVCKVITYPVDQKSVDVLVQELFY